MAATESTSAARPLSLASSCSHQLSVPFLGIEREYRGTKNVGSGIDILARFGLINIGHEGHDSSFAGQRRRLHGRRRWPWQPRCRNPLPLRSPSGPPAGPFPGICSRPDRLWAECIHSAARLFGILPGSFLVRCFGVRWNKIGVNLSARLTREGLFGFLFHRHSLVLVWNLSHRAKLVPVARAVEGPSKLSGLRRRHGPGNWRTGDARSLAHGSSAAMQTPSRLSPY
ncbi:hypothetical protein ACVWY0_002518 [Arthrobacter sp. UYNi723]